MRTDLVRKRILPLGAAVLVMAFPACRGGRAEDPIVPGGVGEELAEAERAIETLEEAYRAVVKEFDGRPITLRDIESACFWSERLMLLQGHAAGFRARDLPTGADRSGPMEQALDDMFDAHIARMEHVEQLVRARAEAGQAPATVVSAARALVVLARASQGSFLHALAAEQDRELDILLPERPEEIPPAGKPRELFVKIDADGRNSVRGEEVTLEELQRILNAESVNNPGRASVIIRADRRTRWDRVVAVMNACVQARIRDYRVTVSVDSDDPAED